MPRFSIKAALMAIMLLRPSSPDLTEGQSGHSHRTATPHGHQGAPSLPDMKDSRPSLPTQRSEANTRFHMANTAIPWHCPLPGNPDHMANLPADISRPSCPMLTVRSCRGRYARRRLVPRAACCHLAHAIRRGLSPPDRISTAPGYCMQSSIAWHGVPQQYRWLRTRQQRC